MGGAAATAEAAAGEAAQLEVLRWHWGSAYRIGVYDGEWRALRLDGLGGPFTACGPGELQRLIVDDYTFRPVRRDLR